MSKTDFNESQYPDDDIATEYEFDYTKAKPNRFVGSGEGLKVVVLDEDVAKVFTTPESVNKALRALIEVVPQASNIDTFGDR
jgi:hypothetical protein